MAKRDSKYLNDVYFYYTRIKEPELCYEKVADPDNEFMNKEYKTTVLVKKDVALKLKKHYIKTVKMVKEMQEVDAADFEGRFGSPAPYEAETYYLFKFTRSASYKDGKQTTPPSVVGKVKYGAIYHDRAGLEVSNEINVGNGSFGALQFTERDWVYNKKAGMSLDLRAICVYDLVEWEPADNELGFDFEEDEVKDEAGDFGGDSDIFGGEPTDEVDPDDEWGDED